MKKLFIVVLLIISHIMLACKHDKVTASADLKAAFEIQKKGLQAIKEIEDKMVSLDKSRYHQEALRLEQFKNNMIEIEGLQHDHSQCNGDHSKKRFTIPDKEMLAVQKEWRDSIVSILEVLP